MNKNLINLNADLGESYGAWKMGDDFQMLQVVKSANLACGFHAGDPLIMRNTVKLAKENKVSIGAHPSYPDLQGFGRRIMNLSLEEIQANIIYQIGALQAIANSEDYSVTHVKAHGALSNQACVDKNIAAAIVKSIYSVNKNLILLAPACSQLEYQGKEIGLNVALEIFADRTYQDDGQLTPRSKPGSVIHDPKSCLEHIKRMLEKGGIVSTSGHFLKTNIHSICVHGDSPNSVDSAHLIRDFLKMQFQLVPLNDLFLKH